ncbi:MAG: ThiF family adenylyltransferase [Thermoplasmata archaeon]|nr:MAG: ThiF family adenylyltransferase [Thermoplasmata archaeon]
MQKKQVSRYSRHIILEEIGEIGQKLLRESTVAVVGCGALGNVIANHLVRAGIGRLRIIDRDLVELDNLQRQILFDEQDVGSPKSLAAQKKLENVNSEVEIEGVVKDLNPNNAEKILGDVNLILDGTDNMETRYLVNDVCVKKNIPWVYGGAVSTYGMSMNIVPQDTACLVCAFPYLPRAGSLPTCDTVGVLNTVPSIIASIQTTEALKILMKKEYNKELIVYDVWNHDFKNIKLKRNSQCKCCTDRNFEYLSAKKSERTTVLCGRNSVQIIPALESDIDLQHLAARLKKVGNVKLSPVHLVFETKEAAINIFKDGRAIVKGTDNETQARTIYAKYIGN